MRSCTLASVPERLSLGLGLKLEDLYTTDGLSRLDGLFLEFLRRANEALHKRLLEARSQNDGYDKAAESELVLDLVPHLEQFIGEIFGIADLLGSRRSQHKKLDPIYSAKRLFVQRRATKGRTESEAALLEGEVIGRELERHLQEPLTESSFAEHVMRWLESEPDYREQINLAGQYALWATLSPYGKAKHAHGVLFKIPQKLNHADLIQLESTTKNSIKVFTAPEDHLRPRDSFKLTDRGATLVEALDHANYCIWCHNQGKDSCSKGLRDRKSNSFLKAPSGIPLAGCPSRRTHFRDEFR